MAGITSVWTIGSGRPGATADAGGLAVRAGDAGVGAATRPSLGRIALNGAAGVSLGFILLPLIFVTWLAFFNQEIPSFPPEGCSLKWFAAAANNKPFVDGFILSLQVGVLATLIGLRARRSGSLALVRHRITLGPAVNTLLLLPLVMPDRAQHLALCLPD